ncbi:hypothetical protein L7F22_017915 [Adiantum nelumboides]|nr:hypothetical protein [Adiantum nelumboides]
MAWPSGFRGDITLGCYQGYIYRNGKASATLCTSQVVRTTILPARDGSYALMHFHHKPHPFSSGQGLGICKAKSASKHLLKGTEHAPHVAQKFLRGSLGCSMQNNQGSDWEREETHWLREEKRWVREEQRWLREEARWAAERKDLLEQTASYREQMKALKVEITQLESQVKEEKSKDKILSELIVGLTRLLQSLDVATLLGRESQASSFQTQISSSSSSATDISRALGTMALEIPVKTIEMATAVNQPSVLETKATPSAPSSYNISRTLKRGAEGDDVKMLQEALAKLGFYSGDNDMEYSSFSSGTERAVRSWQATLGASEDGIVTAELFKKLLSKETASPSEKNLHISPAKGKAAPSAKAVAPTTNSGVKIPDTRVKISDATSRTPGSPGPESTTAKSWSNSVAAETSRPRVYLLGENRWEEPDRLFSNNGPTAATAAATTLGEKCISCKGQGLMMCTECEGTGELNVEEQFLEWADEGAKCPYCEGKGVLDCDVCDGKGVNSAS